MGGDGGGGGGGDGGYAAQQAAQESRKQAARDAVNRIFGVGQATQRTPIYGEPVMQEVGAEGGGTVMIPGDRPIIGYNETQDAELAKAAADRQAGYDRVKSATYDLNKNKLDTDRTNAARELKFALLRTGNSGGGLDIDQNNLLQRKTDEGIIQSTNSADAAALQAKTGDERSRLDLLSRIDAGMDQGSAIQGAQNQLQSSSDAALAQAKGNVIGNVFQNAGLLYDSAAGGQGYANGMNAYMRKKAGAGTTTVPSFSGVINQTGS